MTKFTLIYFDAEARAGPIRNMCAIGNVPYENQTISWQEWKKLKSAFEYRSLPVLRVGRMEINQSLDILRYVSKLAGVYPKDPFHALQVDSLVSNIEEVYSNTIWKTFDKPYDEKVKTRQGFLDVKTGKLGMLLQRLDFQIGVGSSGFLFEFGLSGADLLLFEGICHLGSGVLDGVPKSYIIDNFEVLAKFRFKVASIDEISARFKDKNHSYKGSVYTVDWKWGASYVQFTLGDQMEKKAQSEEKNASKEDIKRSLEMLSSKQKAKQQNVSKEYQEEVKLFAASMPDFLPPKGKHKPVNIPENKKAKVQLLSSALKAAGMNVQLVGPGEASNLKDLCNLSIASPMLRAVFPTTGGAAWWNGNYKSISSPKALNEFKSYFQAMVAEAVGCYPCEVVVLRVSPSSIDVDYTILADVLNKANSAGIKRLTASIGATIKKYTGAKVDTGVTEPCYKISPDDFDQRGDICFPSAKGDVQMRGGRKYFQPSNQYKRIGLQVLDIYGGPKEWLNMNGHKEEWAVAYHGIRGVVPYVISKIIKEKLRPGPNQAYQSSNTVDGKKAGFGIYCSPYLGTASGYTVKSVLATNVIVQCRVRPSAIKDCGNVWVVNNHEDIRPYGLIISSSCKF